MNKVLGKNFLTTLFILVVLLGIFLRFYKLGTNPPSLDWDEASLGYNAYSILKTGADEYGNKLPLSIRSFGDYKPALYVYLDIIPVYLFGLNEFAVRFPAAFLGSLTIIFVYFLAQEMLKGWEEKRSVLISLLVALFFAISPWHLQFSRAAFEGQIGLFFLISGLLFFLKGLKSVKLFYLSSLSFLLSLYSYHNFRLLVPLLVLFLIIVFYEKITSRKHAIISLIFIIVFSIPIWSSFVTANSGAGSRLSMVTIFSDPTVINPSIEKLNFDKQNNDYLGMVFHNRRVIYLQAMAKGYLDHFNPDFLFLHGDGGAQHHAVNMGMLYLWDLPFILAGIYYLIRKINRSILILFVSFLLAPIAASFTTGTPHPVRAIDMMLGFHIFAAAGLVFVLEKINLLKNLIIKSALIFAILTVLIFNIAYYLHQYYVHTPIDYGYFWQYGYKEVLNYVKENESQYREIVMTYQYDQPYVYYLFYNKIDPAGYQKNWDNNKNGTIDRFKRVIGKYTFRNIEYSRDKNIKDALLIGTPNEIPNNTRVVKTINFPDGKEAFKLVKT